MALDPMPRTLEDGRVALMGVKRERFFSRILARERLAALCTPRTADEPNLLEPPTGNVVRRIRDPARWLPTWLGRSAAQSILPKIMTSFSMSQ